MWREPRHKMKWWAVKVSEVVPTTAELDFGVEWRSSHREETTVLQKK